MAIAELKLVLSKSLMHCYQYMHVMYSKKTFFLIFTEMHNFKTKISF